MIHRDSAQHGVQLDGNDPVERPQSPFHLLGRGGVADPVHPPDLQVTAITRAPYSTIYRRVD
jgi:hypothetical protein